MDATTLREVMPGLSAARAQQLVPGANEALKLAHCTTVNRAAMFLAQIGHESVSLKYTAEIASGSAYNGRRDLGNTQPGDGPRYKGRSFIQITGRANYVSFSRWAHSKGLVNSPTYFVDHPLELSNDRWAWIGAVWYWTVARPKLNAQADAGDIVGATRSINGGTNGLADRSARWKRALVFGTRLLPTSKPQEDELSAQFEKEARDRWGRDDLLEKDLRGDLHNKQIQLDRIEATLVVLAAKLDALTAKQT
jgi:predicted chitinase